MIIRHRADQSIHTIHLTTRKDIANIQRAYGLRVAQRHKDDATSVMTWVHSMQQQKYNPFLLYNPQGANPTQECPSLGVNDFMLVLQNSLQAEVLKACGTNKMFCVDDTHGTNSYDFHLTNVLVIDEFGEGYPTAWCLSNRTDLYVQIDFLHAVKLNLGCDVTPK